MKPLYAHYPELVSIQPQIEKAIDFLEASYRKGGKFLVAGNGGSSADSAHIIGELMKGFMKRRSIASLSNGPFAAIQDGIPCVDLTAQQSLLTAFSNDVDPSLIYAQQVYVYGKGCPNDALLVLSTSGNSTNVVKAAEMAKLLGLVVIAFTGEKESKLSSIADVTIQAPACETYRIQEYHLPIYHYICQELEERLFQ